MHGVHAVLVCNEFRSASVQREFEEVFGGHFAMRSVSGKQQQEGCRDENIRLLQLSRRKVPRPGAIWPATVVHSGSPGTPSSSLRAPLS
jgi:hypothetical protein